MACLIFVAMNKMFALFLVFVLLLPLFSKVTVFAVWKYNQKYIIENLCINKSKPALKCKGKCNLMKNLQETEDKEDTPYPEKAKEFKMQPTIAPKNIALLLSDLAMEDSKQTFSYDPALIHFLFVSGIFVPPDAPSSRI